MFSHNLAFRGPYRFSQKSRVRFSTRHGFCVAALLVATVLMPNLGWANTSKNCPVEPAQAAIVSGETYFGTNCVLNTASDLDTFTFKAAAGDIWKIVDGSGNVSAPRNICLTLNDPNGNTVGFGCSAAPVTHSATLVSKLAVSGTYTIIVTETENLVMNYGVSLERISPTPADAAALVLGKTITSQVDPPSAQDAYTFFATTTGTYEVSATMTSGGAPENLCFSVYQSDGTAVVPLACTAANIQLTAQAKFTPVVNGTFLVIVHSSDDYYSLNYNLSVACVAGTCGSPPPKPICKDVPSYDPATGTLTMTFTLATPVAATWNAWLTSQNTMQQLWSESEPATEPAITVIRTQADVAKAGKIGILSTLTTPTGGITCSSWKLVSTGKP